MGPLQRDHMLTAGWQSKYLKSSESPRIKLWICLFRQIITTVFLVFCSLPLCAMYLLNRGGAQSGSKLHACGTDDMVAGQPARDPFCRVQFVPGAELSARALQRRTSYLDYGSARVWWWKRKEIERGNLPISRCWSEADILHVVLRSGAERPTSPSTKWQCVLLFY